MFHTVPITSITSTKHSNRGSTCGGWKLLVHHQLHEPHQSVDGIKCGVTMLHPKTLTPLMPELFEGIEMEFRCCLGG